MAIAPIKRRMQADAGVSGLQDDVIVLQQSLAAIALLGGVQVTVGPMAAAGAFNVQHGLKATPRGYLVLDMKRPAGAVGDASVYRRTGETINASTLALYTSASFDTLTLWVF